MRYQVEVDAEFECYKIIDTQSIIGTEPEEQDVECIAHVFDKYYAELILACLNDLAS